MKRWVTYLEEAIKAKENAMDGEFDEEVEGNRKNDEMYFNLEEEIDALHDIVDAIENYIEL